MGNPIRGGSRIYEMGSKSAVAAPGIEVWGCSPSPLPSPCSFPFRSIPFSVAFLPSLCHLSPSLLHPFPFSPFPPLLFASLPIPFPIPSCSPCREAAP